MIKSVEITNHLGESIEFELTNPYKTGIYVSSITGLGPGKANINTTDLANDDGSIYNSARAEERNIVMKLGFLQVPGITDTIEDARQLTYKYFPKKKPLVFHIITDNRDLQTFGYVESNEPDIFSKNETTQISIICPDPLFYLATNGGMNVTSFNGIDFEFEFPFENNTIDQNTTFIPGVAKNRQVIVNDVSELPSDGNSSVVYYVPTQNQHTGSYIVYFNEYKWSDIDILCLSWKWVRLRIIKSVTYGMMAMLIQGLLLRYML